VTRLALVVATGCYCGYAPVAPGTAGSALGLVVWVAIRALGSPVAEIAALVVLAGVGVWAASVTERHVSRTDPGIIVIDEVVGMLVTVALLPIGVGGALAGFLLFRLFDIIKPYPAAACERLPGGWGVMADDVVAGLYAHLVLRSGLWLLATWGG
jgi:phosphatidylglycerophosphatase A